MADLFDLVNYHMCETMVGTFIYRWKPKIIPRGGHQLIITNAVEDSYKRLILPFLTRSYRYVSCEHEHHWPKVNSVYFCLLPFIWTCIFLNSSSPLCFALMFRTKLTAAAEKESIAMFVRNLRQRLLLGPVRGSVIMGVDPGYKHGCKIAVLSPTSKGPETSANISF